MVKKSSIDREKKRQHLVEKYAAKRKRLREAQDWEGISKLPKNSNPTRLRNRCKVTEGSRGYMRRFDLLRITFPELALGDAGWGISPDPFPIWQMQAAN